MKVVALQLHIIHSTARLKHHGLNAVNSDLISTGSAQEKLQSWNQNLNTVKCSTT